MTIGDFDGGVVDPNNVKVGQPLEHPVDIPVRSINFIGDSFPGNQDVFIGTVEDRFAAKRSAYCSIPLVWSSGRFALKDC